MVIHKAENYCPAAPFIPRQSDEEIAVRCEHCSLPGHTQLWKSHLHNKSPESQPNNCNGFLHTFLLIFFSFMPDFHGSSDTDNFNNYHSLNIRVTVRIHPLSI
ncbi:hypothetical protein AMECASPLE_031801 [Ameca splendens]|uniref:Uncharacterized protein n=1 Tax=Ameca splendens TaxID=208324 RepID=A0ABV0Y6C0_9TELE